MNYIRVKFLKDGEPKGRSYTYKSEVELKEGDIVQIDESKVGIVTNEPVEAGWLEAYGVENVKSILGKRERWIFTFGSSEDHAHPNQYVTIDGTHGSARAKMFEKYGKKWSSQYSQEVWDGIVKRNLEMGWPVETEYQKEEE